MTVDLAAAVAWVESKGRPDEVRFEPRIYHQYEAMTLPPAAQPILALIRDIHKCSHDTAAVFYAMSWGLYQIMGETLYGQGELQETVFDFIGMPNWQNAMFNKLTKAEGIAFDIPTLKSSEEARVRFATRWNGPANTAVYAADLLDAINHLEAGDTS